MYKPRKFLILFSFLFISTQVVQADENLFGYVRGSETLPKGSWEVYEILTSRMDKGQGTYNALDSNTEMEYGFTDSFNMGLGFHMQAIDVKNLTIDAYIPKDKKSGLTPSGLELFLKYNFLSPAKDDIGLSIYLSLNQSWVDPHSGQKKDTTSTELELLLQKYFMEGQVVLVGNLGLESTYAKRYYIADLPAGFEWPNHPEMELGLVVGSGITYRFIPKWFAGVEAEYMSEYETEVGQERWSTFAGPTVHYGSEKWWLTATWFHQLEGAPIYPGQDDKYLHLIEKTKDEYRLKVGFNF